jgi:hypothetical protein
MKKVDAIMVAAAIGLMFVLVMMVDVMTWDVRVIEVEKGVQCAVAKSVVRGPDISCWQRDTGWN